jgi:Transketolase, thiamine diphosphate binding domain
MRVRTEGSTSRPTPRSSRLTGPRAPRGAPRRLLESASGHRPRHAVVANDLRRVDRRYALARRLLSGLRNEPSDRSAHHRSPPARLVGTLVLGLRCSWCPGSAPMPAPMALAPVAYTLWQRFLRFDPDDPIWPNRDRFVLSNGHASMLLYALLAGVKATINDSASPRLPSTTSSGSGRSVASVRVTRSTI